MRLFSEALISIYPLGEWIFYFFIYCFFGWIWECSYVSISDKKLVNRGFMYGPCIPIYGSGALLMIVVTAPFRGNYVLMALAAMVSASVLEYATGMAMEALFKVRYWDYTQEFANLNGYICLKSTIAWGGMALLTVYGIQPALVSLARRIPYEWIIRADGVIGAMAAADFALSFKTAIDLREVLIRTEKIREELTQMRERIAELQQLIAETAVDAKNATIEKASEAKAATIGMASEAKAATIGMASEAKAATIGIASEAKAVTLEYATAARVKAENELRELRLREKFNTEKIRNFTSGSIKSLLRRNPGAVSNKYREALETVKNGFLNAFGESSMEEKIVEHFASGFCKAQNQTRTVLCEFEQNENGNMELVDTDCAYGSCAHQDACMLMKEVLGQKCDS